MSNPDELLDHRPLIQASLELEARTYFTVQKIITAFQAEQEARSLVLVRLMQDRGVNFVDLDWMTAEKMTGPNGQHYIIVKEKA